MHAITRKPFLLVLSLLLVACGPPKDRAASYLEKARELYDAGDYVQAKLEANNAAQLEPKNSEARYLLALIAEKDGRPREMIGQLQVAIDSDPAYVKARVKLGTVYFLGRGYDRAAEQAAAAAEVAPDDPAVLTLQARVLAQQGQAEAALDAVNRSLEFDPKFADAYLVKAALQAPVDVDLALRTLDQGTDELGPMDAEPLRQLRAELLRRGQRFDELETEYIALIAAYPDNVMYPNKLALLYSSRGRIDEAVDIWQGVLQSNPDDVESRLEYIKFISRERSTAEAEAALETFVEQNPDSQPLQLALARFYDSTGQEDLAWPAYEATVALGSRTEEGLDARNQMAAMRIRQGELARARELLDAVLADAPDNVEALLKRGGLSYEAGAYDNAIADARVALRNDETSDRALLLLARAYARTGDLDLAGDAYRRILALEPGHPLAAKELATFSVARGDYATAEAVLRERLTADPTDQEVIAQLVEVLVDRQDLDGAEAYARQLMANGQAGGVGSILLGRVLLQKNEYDEAASVFLEAMEIERTARLGLDGYIRTLAAAGRTEEAIRYLEANLPALPDPLQGKFLLASMLLLNGDTLAARERYEEIVAAQPDTTLAYVGLADTYPEDPDKQAAMYRRGLVALPGNADLGYLLGNLLVESGRPDEAIELYRELLDARPGLGFAAIDLANLLLHYRKDDVSSVDEALEIAKRFADSDDPSRIDSLGWAYFRAGDVERAVRLLERAVVRAGDEPLYRYHLGMAYHASDNPIGARQELSKSLAKADADFLGIDEARSTLEQLDSS